MRLATDTGGTFTDLAVQDDDGKVHLFKASTTPHDPSLGVIDVLCVGAAHFELSLDDFLKRAEIFIHGTTHAINALVTGNTARTALMVTAGHRDILTLREGGRSDPFDFSVPYPAPFVPRGLTFEIEERVGADGNIVLPIDKDMARAQIAKIKALDVEAIAVCLLWSVTNPAHEIALQSLIAEELPDVPVTLSHQVNPMLREYRRTMSTAINASLQPIMTKYMDGLEAALKLAGYIGPTYVLTSQGGMTDIDSVRTTSILSVNSGPSMAPVGARAIVYAERPDCLDDVVIFDTGGTTCDVSLVRSGRIPKTRESWLGEPYRSDMTGFPSVDVRSVGAGGGSVAVVDDGGILHVGPQSSGADPGPACYARGGKDCTVTDAALVLGYIDPEFFLGGAIKLEPEAALSALDLHVADPLKLKRDEAAAAVMHVATENMVQAINDITVKQGIDPAKAICVAGGGAAGINAVAIAGRLGTSQLIIPMVGAALSAFGATRTNISKEFSLVAYAHTGRYDTETAKNTVNQLLQSCETFFGQSKKSEVSQLRKFSVEARYPSQIWEIDIDIDPDEMAAGQLENFKAAFHKEHERLFAYCELDADIEIVGWRVVAELKDEHPKPFLNATASSATLTRQRSVYFSSTGRTLAPVHNMTALAVGQRLCGPAIVETALTSIAIDPGAQFHRSNHGNLIVNPTIAGDLIK